MDKLYHIRQEHLTLLAEIEQVYDGEVTPEIEYTLFLTEKELRTEAVSVGYLIKSLGDRYDEISAEIKRLQDWRNRTATLIGLFKDRIAAAMEQFGIESIQGNYMKLSILKRDHVAITNERLLAPEYFITPVPEISKTLIRDALKAGKDVQGAEFVTRKHLQIK